MVPAVTCNGRADLQRPGDAKPAPRLPGSARPSAALRVVGVRGLSCAGRQAELTRALLTSNILALPEAQRPGPVPDGGAGGADFTNRDTQVPSLACGGEPGLPKPLGPVWRAQRTSHHLSVCPSLCQPPPRWTLPRHQPRTSWPGLPSTGLSPDGQGMQSAQKCHGQLPWQGAEDSEEQLPGTG